MTFVLLKRGLKISGFFGAVAGSAYFLRQNVWEVSTLGIFRFGRAGFAVSIFMFISYSTKIREISFFTSSDPVLIDQKTIGPLFFLLVFKLTTSTA